MTNDKGSVRILHVITLFSVGGATETVVAIAKGLLHTRYEVMIVAGPHMESESDMLPLALDAGIRVKIIPELQRNIHPIKDVRAFLRLRRIMIDGQYDIVHTHSSKAGIIGRLAAYSAGVKIIVHTIHGLPFHNYQNILIKKFYIIAERIAARVTNKLVAVSHRIILDSIKHCVCRSDKFTVIRSGFDHHQYLLNPDMMSKIKNDYKIADEDFVIGKISRLSPLKGHSALIRIAPLLARNIPKIKILFIGDGEIREELESKVRELGIEKFVVFTGAIPPAMVPHAISIMNIVVHTSMHEGLARVIPQALAMGKPVIGYDLDGSPEVIQDGKNGYLVSPLDNGQLFASIINLAGKYSSFIEYTENNKESIRYEFSEEKMVSDYISLYDKLLG